MRMLELVLFFIPVGFVAGRWMTRQAVTEKRARKSGAGLP